MPRPRKYPPPIVHAQDRGLDRVRVYGPDGKPHWHTLGPHGSEQAKGAYAKLLAEMEREREREKKEGLKPERVAPEAPALTVAEVAAKYLEEVVAHRERLRKLSTSQAGRVRRSVGSLVGAFGETVASDFKVGDLEGFRARLVATRQCRNCDAMRAKAKRGEPVPTCRRCTDNPGLARKYCNQLIGCVTRCFRWAGKKGLVPATVYGELRTLENLKAGDDGRDSKDVQPADEASVEKVLPLLPPPIAALVRLQVLTGARPGELMALRPEDIDKTGRVEVKPGQYVDTGGRVWSVRPSKHKTAWRGHKRLILFGPEAQAILKPWLEGRADDAYLFSPAEAMAAFRLRQRGERRDKVRPRRKLVANPKKRPGERYSAPSYHHAVQKACERAGVGRFYPYMLRHNAATWLVEEYGWDLARIVLGHRSLDVTRIYGADNVKKAAEAMGESG